MVFFIPNILPLLLSGILPFLAVYCNRLPIYFPQSYQSDLSKNAILSCQSFFFFLNPSHSFRTKFKLFHLAYVVFQDLPPACHTNFISIVLYVLATLNYLPLFVNAILSNKSPQLLTAFAPSIPSA